ncbi:pirin family protein [Ancylomarina euxinus]|uniref:Pirin family protein n=1 Tax=Ancylomarina euxinus TaxID=2283627 RepID=A0A425Y3R9_9BACT|nr:pirin family protein [Ancylomarina euxinus]MCZ4694496.1 pirin family protein [Ancylomarina euxinus]MUP14039.1 pirin family protein [Ancylomarina euxinus]RRG22899.1 pirin family protein [Ancylomarina euxinus]
MKTVVHKANTRGHANHGWLDAHHTFSFADYYHTDRMHFGVLRVLNDDRIAAGKGFGTHPHNNMEIISIPLKGELEHKDSMGNSSVIKAGEIQVMSAGTGILHSEFNPNDDQEVNLLQIWIFPHLKDVEPRYDQLSISDIKSKNGLKQILSPDADDEGVWIYQNAWFHLGEFDKASASTYTIKQKGNGLYLFVVEGQVFIKDYKLEKRDGLAITETQIVEFKVSAKTKVLLIDVPMFDL